MHKMNAQGGGEHTFTNARMPYEEDMCMGTPEHYLVTRRTNVQGRGREHNHDCSYVFTTRRFMAPPNAPSSRGERTYKRGIRHTHECSYVFMRRRGAWARPKRSLVTRRPNVQGRGLEHKHESSNTFMRRRGAWFPETFHFTRRLNTQGRHKTYTQMLGNRSLQIRRAQIGLDIFVNMFKCTY